MLPSFAVSAAAVMVAAFFPAPAVALTLDQALASTYECSPAIDAERARLRAIDEEVPIAQSGYRPDIAARADVGYRNQNNPSGGSSNQTPRGWGVDLVQPIFRGFSVTNAVNEAQSRVRAGRETLRAVEQEKLAEAVTTFMEVVAQQAILKLNENNLNVLNEELKATRDRFAVGEVTRTDVAQSEARRADAVAQVDQARADLQTARAAFERTVCQPADRLVEPALKKDMLPKSQNEAVDISMQENPRIVGALYTEQAARFNVDTIRGQLLPQVSIEANYDNNFDDQFVNGESQTAAVRGVMTVPIYERGGIVHAQVRQAKQVHLASLQDVEQTKIEVKANAIRAWSQLLGAQAQLDSAKAAVEANTIALTGVREEERVGQRTLIEVLNAQQELLNSQVTLVTTRRDVIVAAYGLQAALGRLDALSLGVTDILYDPQVHSQEVDRQWFGISITHEDGRHERLDVDPSTLK
jgi:outer membrane protein